MGSQTSKVDITVAEQGIRNRINDITSVRVTTGSLYNTINNTLNYVNETGDSMLDKRLLEPNRIVFASECLYSVLKAIPHDMHLDITRKFLINMLEIHLDPDRLSVV